MSLASKGTVGAYPHYRQAAAPWQVFLVCTAGSITLSSTGSCRGALSLSWSNVYQQLKQRRVIRTAIVYLALAWLALQVADLLADSDIISESFVRWLIFASIVGFPLVLLLSWVYEAPWRERKWIAIAGDVGVITAIAIAASVLAWQQWMTSFTRPTIAVLSFVPTDTRADTADLARHLERRFRFLLATRPEVRVIEIQSSTHASIADLPLTEKASHLGADLVLAGTINQGDNEMRLTLRLHDSTGDLLWDDRFEDRFIDQTQLQNAVLNSIWHRLPMSDTALQETRRITAACEYPATEPAVRAIVSAESDFHTDLREQIARFDTFIEAQDDNGLLHLARAHLYFRLLNDSPRARHPVLQKLAMQDLDNAEQFCPMHPQIELDRFYRTLLLEQELENAEGLLARFPNESELRIRLARLLRESGNTELALALSTEANALDPLGDN